MRRRSALTSVALLAAFALASCQDDGPVARSSEVGSTSATTTIATITTTAPPAPTPDPTTTEPAVDPTLLLVTSALDALGSQYHFTTQVSVDGADVLTADGDRVGDGARLTIVQGTTTAEYVIVGDQSWARVDGGAWQALDTAPASTDPLDGLGSARTATLTDGADPGPLRITLAVPALSLGIAADGDATVDVVVTNGVLTEARYATTVGDRPADVSTILGPVVDATPVTPPI